MIGAADIVLGGVLPAAVAAAVVFIMAGRRFHKGAWAVAAAIGYVAGQLALKLPDPAPDAAWWLWPAAIPSVVRSLIPPHVARDWLPWMALAAAGMGLLETWRTSFRWLRIPACVAAPVFLLLPKIRHAWSAAETATWIAGIGGGMCFAWWMAARADVRPSLLRPLVLAIAAMSTAVVLLLSGSQVYGQLGGVLTAVLVAGGIAGLYRGGNQHFAGAGGVAVLILGGLITIGGFYASLTVLNAGLLAGGAILAVAPLPRRMEATPVVHIAARLAAVGLPCGVAIGLATVKFLADIAEPSMY